MKNKEPKRATLTDILAEPKGVSLRDILEALDKLNSNLVSLGDYIGYIASTPKAMQTKSPTKPTA